MDDIVDNVDAAFDCLIIYKIEKLTPDIQSLARILYKSVQEIELGIKELRNLRHAAAIRQNCKEINRLEKEADVILRNAIGGLFEKEQDIRLLIKWKEIYEILEEATDRCEDVSNIIEGILLEYD
jgi:uncharacterized protein